MRATSANGLRLWYTRPPHSGAWDEALPIGNGRLGGMIFGGLRTERVQLNEDSVWYGGPRDRNNPDAYSHLEQIRKLILAGRLAEAERLATLTLSGTPDSQRHYQTLGDLYVSLDGHSSLPSSYVRGLDLSAAIANVRYVINGAEFTREAFVSAVDQVMVIRFTCNKPGMISMTVRISRDRYYECVVKEPPSGLMMKGHCGGEGGVGFRVLVSALAQGGTTQLLGDNLLVDKADAVTLLVAAATTFRYADPENTCRSWVKAAASKPYEELRRDHIADYRSLFDRVSIRLSDVHDLELDADKGCTPEDLPTDQRLQRVRDGADDPGLISLFFQYGRYLLISSSRPGCLPANLQGIWNKEFRPPWDSKFTININTEMNYWPAETCNLSECHLPLFDLIERMREPGRRTARVMYGCRGFTAHHNTDIWADTAPQDIYLPATYWPMGAAWLCLHLYEHYQFSQDRDFLASVYETMKEAAEFFVDFLIEDSEGRLVTCPSVSPENTYRLPSGETGRLCAGPSMDSQIIHALFTACIRSSEILGTDEGFRERLIEMRERLPKPKIGRYGQIQEWAEDYEEVEPGHRHISHLFALYPGNQILRRQTPELAAAAKVTLQRRLAHGGGHTGWSRAWIINFWARLGEGELAYENVKALLAKSTLPNLFSNHPPFQIDGNFGGTAGIAEMLLQSHAGEIELLPALPRAWRSGEVRGLRARGGFEVDIAWSSGSLSRAVVRSRAGNIARVRYGELVCEFDTVAGCGYELDGELKLCCGQ